MSPLDRTLEGDVLVHHLALDKLTIDQALVARSGRSARTLVKEGPLRLTLMGIAAGGDMPVHRTPGPVSIHVLDGDVVIDALGHDYPLATGDILVVAPGVEHSVRSTHGGLLLLTVVHADLPGTTPARA